MRRLHHAPPPLATSVTRSASLTTSTVTCSTCEGKDGAWPSAGEAAGAGLGVGLSGACGLAADGVEVQNGKRSRGTRKPVSFITPLNAIPSRKSKPGRVLDRGLGLAI